jgi:hypothetical protein
MLLGAFPEASMIQTSVPRIHRMSKKTRSKTPIQTWKKTMSSLCANPIIFAAQPSSTADDIARYARGEL